jgi:transposase
MENRILIQQLLALGWSYRRIEAETGIRRETISKYDPKHPKSQASGLEGSANPAIPFAGPTDPPNQNRPNCPPTLTTSAPSNTTLPQGKTLMPAENSSAKLIRPSHSSAAVYDDIIRQKLSHGLTAQRIYQDLVTDHDFTQSYDCVKRYIRHLKQQQPKVFARLHTRPGEEAQVDFGLAAPTLKNGRYMRPWFFKIVLSHSRHSYEEAVWQQDVETFLRCHERAFAAFGGVPRVIRLDNLKSGVLSTQLYEPVLNPVYLAFAKHTGFAPLPCLPRKPEHKGKTESGVGYTKNNALHALTFDSLEAQNAHLRHWNQTWARTRIHGTTKRQVWAVFVEAERPALQPLPDKPFQYFHIGARKVHADGHIEVERAYYSVPHRFVGQSLTVHFNAEWVKVLYQTDVVAFHRKAPAGHFQTDKQHLPENKCLSTEEFQARLLRRCQDLGRDCYLWALNALQTKDQLALRAIQGVVRLQQKYPTATINQACERALKLNSVRYSTVKLLCDDQEEAITAQASTQLELLQEHELIRSLGEYHDYLNQLAETSHP